MKNQTSKYLKYAIGEIILVVIGILIALQVNNWNEAIQTENSVNQTLKSLKNEISVNQKQIKTVFEYHKMLRDTLRNIDVNKLLEQERANMGFWKGHRVFRLSTASFQTAVQTGALKTIDIEISEALNNLYTSIAFYNDFGQSINTNMYTINLNTEDGLKQMFGMVKMILEDIYYGESNLLVNFNISLQLIDKKLQEN